MLVVNKTTMEVIRRAHTPDFPTADFLHAPAGLAALEAAETPSKYWKVSGDGLDIEEKTQAEKDAQDAADFPGVMAAKAGQMSIEVQAYIFARYDENTQMSLGFLYKRAVETGKTNRAAHIAPAIDWVLETVLTYFYARKAAICATTNQTGLDAESWDFSTYDASDPEVTIESALAITD